MRVAGGPPATPRPHPIPRQPPSASHRLSTFVLTLVSPLAGCEKTRFICFDKQHERENPVFSMAPPFALRLSKGEHRVFPQPARGGREFFRTAQGQIRLPFSSTHKGDSYRLREKLKAGLVKSKMAAEPGSGEQKGTFVLNGPATEAGTWLVFQREESALRGSLHELRPVD